MFKSSPSSPETQSTTLAAYSSPLSLLGFSEDEQEEQENITLGGRQPTFTSPNVHSTPQHNISLMMINTPLKSPIKTPSGNSSKGNLLLSDGTNLKSRNEITPILHNHHDSPFNMSNTMDSDDDDDLLVDIDSPLLEFGHNNAFSPNVLTNNNNNNIIINNKNINITDSNTKNNSNSNSIKSTTSYTSSSSEKTSQISSDSSSSATSSKKSSSLKSSNSTNSIGSNSKNNTSGSSSTLTIKSKPKSSTEKQSIKKKSPKKKKEETKTKSKKKVEFKKVESGGDSSSSESERENKKKRKKKEVVMESSSPKKWKKKKVEETDSNVLVSGSAKKSLCRQFTEMITEVKKITKKDHLDLSEDESDDYMDVSSSEELLSSESEKEIVKRTAKRKKNQPKKKLFTNIKFVISNSLIENDKEKLEKKIKEENGTIIRQLSSNNLDSCQDGKVVLISEKTSTKPTYLIALLLDIPILKKDWVFDSIAKKKLITDDKNVQKYLLDRGLVKSRVDPTAQHIEKQIFNSSLLCSKKENRIFYGCKVKILGHEKELSSWIGLMTAGGAIIDNELTTQTSEGSNFIFVKDSNNLTEEDVEKASSMRLPILDGDSLLQIVTTLERKFSEEQVLNYVELSQLTKKTQPLSSINLLEMSMPLIELPDETDIINNMDLIDKIEFGNFFDIGEQDNNTKLSFTRIATYNGDTICEKYYTHDMVVLDYLNEEIICRIDSLYYCGNIATLSATQYYSNPKRKLQKTNRKLSCSLEHVKYKLNICGPIRHKSQHLYSNQRFNTKTGIISDILEDIKTVGETCLTLEQCKEHKFKWLPPFKTNLYEDHVTISTLKWRKQLFQQGDYILIKLKQSDSQIVGQITEFREYDTTVFVIPSSRKYPISQGALYVEILEKINQPLNKLEPQLENSGPTSLAALLDINAMGVYKTTHQVERFNIETIQHVQSLMAIHYSLLSPSCNLQQSRNLIIIQ